ncbi:MAG: hypothetical protein IKN12_11670 [Selenomonadaceae bacterium]|nr:hypothetical protein [Selenomonadaceae bacterium]
MFTKFYLSIMLVIFLGLCNVSFVNAARISITDEPVDNIHKRIASGAMSFSKNTLVFTKLISTGVAKTSNDIMGNQRKIILNVGQFGVKNNPNVKGMIGYGTDEQGKLYYVNINANSRNNSKGASQVIGMIMPPALDAVGLSDSEMMDLMDIISVKAKKQPEKKTITASVWSSKKSKYIVVLYGVSSLVIMANDEKIE